MELRQPAAAAAHLRRSSSPYILPNKQPDIQPYFLFLFCGILPWTWFQASLAESAGVLIASANLIKKVLFPAEVLPTVCVLANLAHFLLGLPILLAVLAFEGKLRWTALLLPLPLLVQLVLTLGMALFLSALTVHFRDIQNILSHVLHLWFFATPVIYSYAQIAEGTPLRRLLRLNPMTHVVVTYQQMLFHGNVDHWRGLLAVARWSASWRSPWARSCSTACATRWRRKCDEAARSSRRT